METQVNLGVYRRFDHQLEGLNDDSPLDLQLHQRRQRALHNIFDGVSEVRVTDWGKTDDTQPHEYVELTVVVAVAGAVLQYAVVPGLEWLGKRLMEKLADQTASELAKWLVSKLRPKQETKEVLDFIITFKDGSSVRVDPPDRAGTIIVTGNDGTWVQIDYRSGQPQ